MAPNKGREWTEFVTVAALVGRFRPVGPDEVAACKAMAERLMAHDLAGYRRELERLQKMQEVRPKLEAAAEAARQAKARKIIDQVDAELAQIKAKEKADAELVAAATRFKMEKEREKTWAREMLDTLKGFRTRAGRPTPAKFTAGQLSGTEPLPEGYIRCNSPGMPIPEASPKPKGRGRR